MVARGVATPLDKRKRANARMDVQSAVRVRDSMLYINTFSYPLPPGCASPEEQSSCVDVHRLVGYWQRIVFDVDFLTARSPSRINRTTMPLLAHSSKDILIASEKSIARGHLSTRAMEDRTEDIGPMQTGEISQLICSTAPIRERKINANKK